MEITMLFWLIGSVIAGAIAEKKGRSFLGVCALSLVLSPVVGIATALIMSPNEKELAKLSVAEGKGKICPFCAELIKPDAKVCRYCGRDLTPDEAPA